MQNRNITPQRITGIWSCHLAFPLKFPPPFINSAPHSPGQRFHPKGKGYILRYQKIGCQRHQRSQTEWLTVVQFGSRDNQVIAIVTVNTFISFLSCSLVCFSMWLGMAVDALTKLHHIPLTQCCIFCP